MFLVCDSKVLGRKSMLSTELTLGRLQNTSFLAIFPTFERRRFPRKVVEDVSDGREAEEDRQRDEHAALQDPGCRTQTLSRPFLGVMG